LKKSMPLPCSLTVDGVQIGIIGIDVKGKT